MYSMKQFLSDLKFAIVISVTIFPPVIIMVLDLPVWLWIVWSAWMALFVYANSRRVRMAIRKCVKRRSRKFTSFTIDKEEIEQANTLDDIA